LDLARRSPCEDLLEEKLAKMALPEEETAKCPICMDSSIDFVLGCDPGHAFCAACTFRCWNSNSLCPLCRRSMTTGHFIGELAHLGNDFTAVLDSELATAIKLMEKYRNTSTNLLKQFFRFHEKIEQQREQKNAKVCRRPKKRTRGITDITEILEDESAKKDKESTLPNKRENVLLAMKEVKDFDLPNFCELFHNSSNASHKAAVFTLSGVKEISKSFENLIKQTLHISEQIGKIVDFCDNFAKVDQVLIEKIPKELYEDTYQKALDIATQIQKFSENLEGNCRYYKYLLFLCILLHDQARTFWTPSDDSSKSIDELEAAVRRGFGVLNYEISKNVRFVYTAESDVEPVGKIPQINACTGIKLPDGVTAGAGDEKGTLYFEVPRALYYTAFFTTILQYDTVFRTRVQIFLTPENLKIKIVPRNEICDFVTFAILWHILCSGLLPKLGNGVRTVEVYNNERNYDSEDDEDFLADNGGENYRSISINSVESDFDSEDFDSEDFDSEDSDSEDSDSEDYPNVEIEF